MAALTDATLLCALNAVDLCDKCDIKFVRAAAAACLELLVAKLVSLTLAKRSQKTALSLHAYHGRL